jgi:hypothetical protein
MVLKQSASFPERRVTFNLKRILISFFPGLSQQFLKRLIDDFIDFLFRLFPGRRKTLSKKRG